MGLHQEGTMKKALIALVLLGALGVACKHTRDGDQVPPPTLTGRATFPSSGSGVVTGVEAPNPQDIDSVSFYAGQEGGRLELAFTWEPTGALATYETHLDGKFTAGANFVMLAEVTYHPDTNYTSGPYSCEVTIEKNDEVRECDLD
jgi:hypothetical protein